MLHVTTIINPIMMLFFDKERKVMMNFDLIISKNMAINEMA